MYIPQQPITNTLPLPTIIYSLFKKVSVNLYFFRIFPNNHSPIPTTLRYYSLSFLKSFFYSLFFSHFSYFYSKKVYVNLCFFLYILISISKKFLKIFVFLHILISISKKFLKIFVFFAYSYFYSKKVSEKLSFFAYSYFYFKKVSENICLAYPHQPITILHEFPRLFTLFSKKFLLFFIFPIFFSHSPLSLSYIQ